MSIKLHNKHKFTPDEDNTISILVERYETDNWKLIAKEFSDRSVRQLREK
jgi:phenylpyruvate tautomerase PptA (4-oxalocrotonate tautomerase family)